MRRPKRGCCPCFARLPRQPALRASVSGGAAATAAWALEVPVNASSLRQAGEAEAWRTAHYSATGRLRVAAKVAEGVFECSASCGCERDCANRVVQRGAFLPLQLFRRPFSKSALQWAVRCAIDVPAGSFVAEYAGTVITDAEAETCRNRKVRRSWRLGGARARRGGAA
jgi:hypothetical protein